MTVRVRGDVDLATAPRLRSMLVDLDRRGVHRVTIDLRAVPFIDSTGVGVLIGALRRARSAGGQCVISAWSDDVGRLFDLLGLWAVFPTDSPSPAAGASTVDGVR